MDKGWESDLSIDLFINKLVQQGQLNAHITLPFLTTISSDSELSTIDDNTTNYENYSLFRKERRGWYIDADIDDLYQQVRKTTHTIDTDADNHLNLYLEIPKWVIHHGTNGD